MLPFSQDGAAYNNKIQDLHAENQELKEKVTELTQKVDAMSAAIKALNNRAQDAETAASLFADKISQLEAQLATASSQVDTLSSSSLLLGTQPEILRKVHSFLSLKEALVLRQVHRQFNEESSNDIYQYSFIMNFELMEKRGFNLINHYLNRQTRRSLQSC